MTTSNYFLRHTKKYNYSSVNLIYNEVVMTNKPDDNPYFRGTKKWNWAMGIMRDTLEYDDPHLIQKVQEGFCEAVDDHNAWLGSDSEGRQIDPDMLDWLQYAFKDVLSGSRSKFLEPQTTNRQRLKKTAHQKKLIEDAVFYIYCVEHGLIKDQEPVKKIADLYGVSKRSVHAWVKSPEFEDVKRRDPHQYWPTGGRLDPVIAISSLESHGLMYLRLYSPLKNQNV